MYDSAPNLKFSSGWRALSFRKSQEAMVGFVVLGIVHGGAHLERSSRGVVGHNIPPKVVPRHIAKSWNKGNGAIARSPATSESPLF